MGGHGDGARRRHDLPPGAVSALTLRAAPLALAEPPLELLHPAADVEDLLPAGVEGVAGRADVGVDDAVAGGAAGREGVAARAGDGGLDVRRVNVGLHAVLSR